MKYFIKGIGLGLSLNITSTLCARVFFAVGTENMFIISAIIFCIITTAFLISDTVANLLLCGFTGLVFMFLGELFFFGYLWYYNKIEIYLAGMFGSIAAIVFSILITLTHIKIPELNLKDGVCMSKELKLKLIIYTVVTAVSFSYLVLPEKASISVPIFSLIQFACLWFIVPDKRKLLLFIPIFIMSLNSFISANVIWKPSNFIICIILYLCIITELNFKKDNFEYVTNIITGITSAFAHFSMPFKWMLEINAEKAPVIKRIAIALLISLPCAIILITVLSNADMVFSLKTTDLIMFLLDFINANTFFKVIYGIATGLFAFCILYNAYLQAPRKNTDTPKFKGDLIVINTLLAVVLSIYTLFVIIQFKYLFAGTTLPDGLTYTEYARKGFFELLSLTGINIAAILSVIRLTKLHDGKWLTFTKILCHYLCAVTVILLISSFYRMLLYTNDDGLTRLRFFVMGFLIFEVAGLIITFIYIAKPNFNITLVYCVIALTYYTVLNIIPSDNIIAKNQINKYLNGQRTGLDYIFTLSADAAPSMEYLLNKTDDEELKKSIDKFLKNTTSSDIPYRWQRYNYSIEKASR